MGHNTIIIYPNLLTAILDLYNDDTASIRSLLLGRAMFCLLFCLGAAVVV